MFWGENMKTVLICPDSYKECLSSREVASCMEKGVKKACADAKTICFSASDGGEGFLECVENLYDCKRIYLKAHDPLSREITTSFLMSLDGKTAWVELAQASGLWLINESERNIMISNTFGTGETIRCAVNKGAETVIVGLGGSATNDCGVGLLSALGAKFFDNERRSVPPSPDAMGRIFEVDSAGLCFGKNVCFVAACDVKNPLCGSKGAASVFSRQKGATEQETQILEKNAFSFAKNVGFDVDTCGAGAAGGVGFALMHFLGAGYISGAEILTESPKFVKALKSSQLIITGEGRTDSQTADGKLVSVVAKKAADCGVPVAVISGSLADDLSELYNRGVTAAFSTSRAPYDIEYSIKNAPSLITQTSREVAALFFK